MAHRPARFRAPAAALAAALACAVSLALTGCEGTPAPRPRPLLAGFDPARLAGQVGVLVFWASWCEVCGRNVADVAALARRTPAADATFVGITEDEAPDAAQSLADHAAPPFDSARDPEGALARRYHVGELTSVVVLDRGGKARFHHRRVDAQELAALAAEIRALDAEPR